jgi:hypothetical protein
VLALTACEFTGSLEGAGALTPLVAVDSFRTVVSGVILDAVTGDPVASPAQISFAGEAGDLVRDLFGAPVEGWTGSQGFASFGIANTVRPRPDRPVDLRVIARAAGYLTNSTRVEMRRDGRHEFRVVLVPAGFLSEAAVGSTAFEILGDSTLGETLVTATSLDREVLLVTIPASTRVSPANGADGERVLQATWTPPSAASLSRFPGGMDAGVRLQDGPDLPATLTTGALFSLTTTPAGPAGLLGFADSLEITTVISPALRSPRTNATILPGDVVDVLRWKPDEGIWLEHAQVQVQRLNGDMAATFRSAQTGTFSVGFFNGHCSDGRVTLVGNTRGGSVRAWHGTPGQADALRVWRFGPGQPEVTLEAPPGFWQGTLEVRHDQDTQSVRYTGLCGEQFDIALARSPAPDLIDITASPLACSSFGVTDVPILSVLAIPRPSPLSVQAALLRPPYMVSRLALTREVANRVTGFSFGPVQPDDRLYLTMGGRHWAYSPTRGGVLDVSTMARETGLCT